MSRIDDLIRQHCPEGVDHRMLGEIAHYSRERVSADSLDESSFVGVDNLIADKGGKVPASYSPNSAMVTSYNEGDVLIGNIRPYLKKIWLADNAGGCSGDVLAVRRSVEFEDRIDPPFLYYVLSSDAFFSYNMQNAKGAKMPRGSKEAILKFRIPVPPLEVQREIVRVLDLFQSLEAELEAELEARRRQYAHYRDSLLDFTERGGVRWMTLGEVAVIGTGGRNTIDAEADGEYPFFVRSQEPLSLNQFDFEESAVITAGDGVGVGKIFHFVDGRYALHQRAYRVVPNTPDLRPEFLFRYIQSDFGRYLEQTSVHSSVTSLRRPMFEKYPIPLPPLEEQDQVIGVLRKFDALVNDISIGLPSELAARRSQYEYYRDCLLTFEEAA